MKRFQILCVTMHQTDFAKIQEMNIHSDVVFANQADRTEYKQIEFDGHSAQMITTNTRGVGKNRNIGLLYADGDICLFADDDVVYDDDAEMRILNEFEMHPDADIMIFHLDTDNQDRKQKRYRVTRKCRKFERMPWGTFRIAFRLNSVKKANLWFSTLFGGGCTFPSGEDSKWLLDAKRAGLTFYVSHETIGTVSHETSTWYTGKNENFFYGRGAMCQALHSRMFGVWALYYALRLRANCSLNLKGRLVWMRHGKIGYQQMLSYVEYKKMMTDREERVRME